MRYGLSTVCGLLIIFSITIGKTAQQEDSHYSVPDEFIGDWVPVIDTCASPLRLRVAKHGVTLIYDDDKQTFGDLHLCYSCQGGAGYSGIVVWLEPEWASRHLRSSPFIIRFNDDERAGITVIDSMHSELAKRFPMDSTDLRKCK